MPRPHRLKPGTLSGRSLTRLPQKPAGSGRQRIAQGASPGCRIGLLTRAREGGTGPKSPAGSAALPGFRASITSPPRAHALGYSETPSGLLRQPLTVAALFGLFTLLLPVSMSAADGAGHPLLVERKDFVKHLTFTGELEAVNSVVIPAPRTSISWRYVVSYLAAEGTYVRPGDLLVEFDASGLATKRLELEKQREEARIKIAQKEAELEGRLQDLLLQKATAEKNFKTAELYPRIDPRLISRADAEKYEFDHSKAKIELEKINERLATLEESGKAELALVRLEFQRAELELRQLLTEQDRMRIRAPAPGLVIYGSSPDRADKVQVGDELWTGWPVLYLPDMNDLQVVAYVTDTDFPLLTEGMPAEIVFDAAPERSFPGQITQLPQMAKPREYRSPFKVFHVPVRLLEKDLELMKPGMTARLRIPVPRNDVLVVPRAALDLSPDGTVFVRRKDSGTTPVRVVDANWREAVIEADLRPGEELLLANRTAVQAQGHTDWLPVQKQDLLFTVPGTGILEAEKSVQIGPPPLSDHWQFKIVRMVPEGGEVREGDFLLAFDPTDIQKRLREETANLQKASEEYEKTKLSQELQIKDLELQLEEARVQQEKAENKLREAEEFEADLKVREARFEAELEQKRVDALERKLRALRQQVEIQLKILKDTENLHRHRVETNRKALEMLTINAPTSGVVVYETNWRNERRQVGSQVHRMEKVLSLPDLNTMVVKGQVAELDAGKLRLGQAVTVSLDAVPDRTFSGQIVEIGSIFRRAAHDRPIKVLDIKVKLEALDLERMRPGMVAKLQVILDRFQEILAVPLSAIQVEDGKSFIWVREQNRPVKREIKVGRNNGIVAAVEAGLEEGQEVAGRAQP